MSFRVLHAAKYFLWALAAPGLWLLQSWLTGGLAALLASPLKLFIAFAAAGGLLMIGLAIRRWITTSRACDDVRGELSTREQRLCHCVSVHQITHGPRTPTFLRLNMQERRGSYPYAGEATVADDEDLQSKTVGMYSLLDVQRNLLLQPQEEDARLWWRLLDNYGRRAPRGVLLTLDAAQLLNDNEAQWQAAALALRLRLSELAQRWGEGLPLQVVVAGCDDIAGFLLSQPPVAMPGLVFTPGDGKRALHGLAQRIQDIFPFAHARFLAQMDALPDSRSRRHAYLFPTDWARLAQRAESFLNLLLTARPGKRQCWMQSLYFCPGRDSDTSSSAMYQTLLQVMGDARKTGSMRQQARRIRAALRLSPGVLTWAGIVLLLIGVVIGYQLERQRLARLAETLTVLAPEKQAAAHLDNNYLTRLNAARQLWQDTQRKRSPLGRKMVDDARQLYRQMLMEPLLADSRRRLEKALAADEGNTVRLLAAYLTLNGGAARTQRENAVAWLSESWRRDPLVGLTAQQRNQLAGHLHELLAQMMPDEAGLNQGLIQQQRTRLLREPQPTRLLEQLLMNDELQARPELEEREDIDLTFRTGEERRVTQSIQGRYSLEGYQRLRTLLVQQLPAVLAMDNHLLGETSPPEIAVLTDSIMKAYYADYIAWWESLLADLSFVLPTRSEAWGRWLVQLAQDDSPLFTLLKTIQRETRLTPSEAENDNVVERDPVTRHFASLQRTLALPTFNKQLQQALMVAAREIQMAEYEASTSPALLQTLVQAIASAPKALQPLLQQLLDGSRDSMRQQQQAQINQRWQNRFGEECRRALADRYPFDEQAKDEISLADFTRWFSPQGTLASFMEEADGEPLPDSLFARLTSLQDFFFSEEDKRIALSFNIRPESMHTDIDSFELTDGVKTLRYAHGPLRPVVFQWPEQASSGEIRAAIRLHTGDIQQRVFRGSWAWFQLFAQMEGAHSHEGNRLSLDFSGYAVDLRVTFPSGKTVPEALWRPVDCPQKNLFS